MRVFRNLVGLAALVCLGVGAVVAVEVLRSVSRQRVFASRATPALEAGAAQRLAGAVRLRTISYDTPSQDSDRALLALHAYLEASFPRVHAALRREVINQYSLLYTWVGRNPALRPLVFMAHQDVVPIAPGTEGQWQVAPFSGEIREGFVWGRGAWDDKGNLMAILEAAEALVAAGFTPQSTLYFVFGHDEENGGNEGAKAIAELLRRRAVRPQFVLDEGLLIADGILPGLDRPVALIGIAEKGAVTLKLTTRATPGHSSMPGEQTAIGSLAAALVRVEQSPFPATVVPVVREMFETLAPEMHGLNRVALANLWLLKPLVTAQLTKTPSGNALLRTTTAITVIRSGNKDNVLPESAEALVNFRLLPGESVADVVAHVRRVAGEKRLRIEIMPQPIEPSPVAASDSQAYRLIERTVRELDPHVVVAPGLMIGTTDSRHFESLADDVYRFSPVRARPEDLARFHGTDERISIANYAELIAFYRTLIEHAAGP